MIFLPLLNSTTHELLAGSNSTTVRIPTQADDDFEPNGSITLELLPSEGYTVSPILESIASINIVSDDLIQVSIAAQTDELTELEAATNGINYTLRFSESIPDTGLNVNLEFETNRAAYNIDRFKTVRVQPSIQSVTDSIMITDNNNFDPNGYIIVKVLPSETYQLALNQEHEVTVNIQNDEYRSGLEIFPITESVLEGEPVKFGIKIDRSRTFEELIHIQVNNKVGNFIDEKTKPWVIPIPANWRVKDILEFEIPTLDNKIWESLGEVSVKILNSGLYNFSVNKYRSDCYDYQ